MLLLLHLRVRFGSQVGASFRGFRQMDLCCQGRVPEQRVRWHGARAPPLDPDAASPQATSGGA